MEPILIFRELRTHKHGPQMHPTRYQPPFPSCLRSFVKPCRNKTRKPGCSTYQKKQINRKSGDYVGRGNGKSSHTQPPEKTENEGDKHGNRPKRVENKGVVHAGTRRPDQILDVGWELGFFTVEIKVHLHFINHFLCGEGLTTGTKLLRDCERSGF